MEGIADCQYLCRRDQHEGGTFWCTIRKDGCDEVDLTGLLSYIETPSFEMRVAEKSPLRDYFEMPIKPGTYPTFSAARALMIKRLPEGKYRLHYGGYGRGRYFSDSVYDFIVKPVEIEEAIDSKIRSEIMYPKHIAGIPIYDKEKHKLDDL